MDRPEPVGSPALLESLANGGIIERLSPADLQRLEAKPEPCRVIDQTIPKFPIAEHEARGLQQRNLAAHRVVGQAAAAEQNLRLARTRQLAQKFFGGTKIGCEGVGAMGDGAFLEGLPHFGMNINRPWQIAG